MIITRTPLRISLAGGGTDLPSWYENHGSMFISAAIDKYIYITLLRSGFDPRIRLRYSKMEEVDRLEDVQHDIIRETLRLHGIKDSIELTSHAEIPSGTGLGSHALINFNHSPAEPNGLVREEGLEVVPASVMHAFRHTGLSKPRTRYIAHDDYAMSQGNSSACLVKVISPTVGDLRRDVTG